MQRNQGNNSVCFQKTLLNTHVPLFSVGFFCFNVLFVYTNPIHIIEIQKCQHTEIIRESQIRNRNCSGNHSTVCLCADDRQT